ncbi:hypothetical protein FHX08_003301 [Rhizobium sp. BK529]|uniref:hypothetical protein n=1 Tax=unclassified Rhizobium TaxID=2613769 RepID=UPI001048DF48|nr:MULTISPECIES: hypothetical protein [unclassified Rhizobium]MBB3592957.1 hypothetical protein [Rhizobium sp. BK529]
MERKLSRRMLVPKRRCLAASASQGLHGYGQVRQDPIILLGIRQIKEAAGISRASICWACQLPFVDVDSRTRWRRTQEVVRFLRRF